LKFAPDVKLIVKVSHYALQLFQADSHLASAKKAIVATIKENVSLKNNAQQEVNYS
jgi:hypothetical protein